MAKKQPASSGTSEKVSEYREGSRAKQTPSNGGKGGPKIGVTPRPATYTGKSERGTGVDNTPAYRR